MRRGGITFVIVVLGMVTLFVTNGSDPDGGDAVSDDAATENLDPAGDVGDAFVVTISGPSSSAGTDDTTGATTSDVPAAPATRDEVETTATTEVATTPPTTEAAPTTAASAPDTAPPTEARPIEAPAPTEAPPTAAPPVTAPPPTTRPSATVTTRPPLTPIRPPVTTARPAPTSPATTAAPLPPPVSVASEGPAPTTSSPSPPPPPATSPPATAPPTVVTTAPVTTPAPSDPCRGSFDLSPKKVANGSDGNVGSTVQTSVVAVVNVSGSCGSLLAYDPGSPIGPGAQSRSMAVSVSVSVSGSGSYTIASPSGESWYDGKHTVRLVGASTGETLDQAVLTVD